MPIKCHKNYGQGSTFAFKISLSRNLKNSQMEIMNIDTMFEKVFKFS